MRSLLPALALMPLNADAGSDIHPLLFSYHATLATCLTDPAAPDLAGRCAEALKAAYILRRATARAAAACTGVALQDCPGPFEEEGLPAISVRIATDVGCDATPIANLPDLPVDGDHCISIASDIMFDEGVIPLDTTLACTRGTDCIDIARLNAAFWAEQIITDDPTLKDLHARNAADCGVTRTAQADQSAPLTSTTEAAFTCYAERSAALWADVQTQDD